MKNNSKSEYDVCVNMRIAESEIQWERYNAMLVVNTIFIALIGLTFNPESVVPILVKQILPPMGIVLCLLWFQMTKRGFMWTKFWTDLARIIEEKYGNKNQINPFIEGLIHKAKNKTVINTKNASYFIICIFIGIYLIIFINNIIPYICCLCRIK